MQLTDHSNRLVTGEVLNRLEQQADVVLAIAEKVIAPRAEQGPDLTGDMVVVNVKPAFVSTIGTGIRSLANRTLAILGRKHRLILLDRNTVAEFEVAMTLKPTGIRRQVLISDRSHVGNDRSVWIISNKGLGRWRSLGATRLVIQALLKVEHLSAVFARFKNPATGADVRSGSGNDFAGSDFALPLPELGESAFFAPMFTCSGIWEVGARLNRLAMRAGTLTWPHCREFWASLRKMPMQPLGAYGFITPIAENGTRAWECHSSAFGTLASRIKRLTATESVTDHAAARRSSLSWIALSTLTTRFLSLLLGFFMQCKCTMNASAVQLQIKENLAVANC